MFKYSLGVIALYLLGLPLANLYADRKCARMEREYQEQLRMEENVPFEDDGMPILPPKKEFKPKPLLPPAIHLEYWGNGKASWFGGPKESWRDGILRCHVYPEKRVKDLQGDYCAIRFPLDIPKKELKKYKVHVSANGKTVIARLVDYGPAKWTGRIIDLSPSIMAELGISTDENVNVWVEKSGNV